MTARLCAHGDKEWRCTICCVAYLRRNETRLRRTVRTRTSGTGDGPRPPFGSREPININAHDLIQDLNSHGGTDGLEHKLNTYRDPQALATLQRQTRQYRSRCALILRDAVAPYPLTWDTPTVDSDGHPTVRTLPIGCPVVSEHGGCPGELYVHADPDPLSPHYGKAAVIQCHTDDDHEWTLAAGGWLRLGVLLGGRLDDTA
jgi:hypothetical protein